LKDPQQRDQFAIRYKGTTEIYWSDLSEPVRINTDSSGISDSLDSFTWSPNGSYFATFHGRGIILHGGPDFHEVVRLMHVNVKSILFSRNERYALTWDGNLGTDHKDAVCLWEVPAGQLLRKFPCSRSFETFAFSADERFIAVQGANGIGMWGFHRSFIDRFTLPGVEFAAKSCFGVPNILNFVWSPVGNALAYFVPETAGKPATVVILDILMDRRIHAVTLTNVESVGLAGKCEVD
jgi:translation initiation factor 3 subunit B